VSWDLTALPSQAGKTFVVTGGASGIGYFICEQLAGTGARVIIAGRNKAKADVAIASIAQHSSGVDVGFVYLDLGSLASVRVAAAELAALGRIDGLIENAGVIMPSKERQETVDGNELMFGTNHLGHFLLTALLFPTLHATPGSRVESRKEQGSRVVTMGSGATRLTRIDLDDLQSSKNYSSWRAYGQSKHATQSFGFELDRRLRVAESRVTALVAHPGAAQDAKSPFRAGIVEPTRLQRMLGLLYVIARGKDTAAWPIVRAAIDPDAEGGQYWGPRVFTPMPSLVRPAGVSQEEVLGRALWARSEEFVGQKFEV
jgi:NAD(P)-dependent dehydrogenase (short-subunit alcohol dehydrogenase family)